MKTKSEILKIALVIMIIIILVLISLVFFYKGKKISVENVSISNSHKEVYEIIRSKGKDLEPLVFKLDDWEYVYYRIPQGYYSININISEKKQYYKGQVVITYASDDGYVEYEKLVRFKHNNKQLSINENIKVPELKVKN